MPGVRNVQAITSAKVPIIKFTSLGQYKTRIEGDISLYNILAQENTQMLRFYSNIDQRVRVSQFWRLYPTRVHSAFIDFPQILGYLVKHFAKHCDMGDASRGSLSSYAYILMLIHFLQQRPVPVIPVLQVTT